MSYFLKHNSIVFLSMIFFAPRWFKTMLHRTLSEVRDLMSFSSWRLQSHSSCLSSYAHLRNDGSGWQLRWFGHVRKTSASRTPQRWLKWKPSTTRLPGRPRKRCMDDMKGVVEKERPQFEKRGAKNCNLWTDSNGEFSSLTDPRPIRTAVQGTTCL